MVRAQNDATVQTIDYLLQFIQAINIDVEITALSKEFTLSIGEVIFQQSDSKILFPAPIGGYFLFLVPIATNRSSSLKEELRVRKFHSDEEVVEAVQEWHEIKKFLPGRNSKAH
ncbi:ctp synthase [Lasius niger]|uniref:Ctp synthase n=1 Tax=Lasius niger TaxID=67767 RepID=A0A0J7L655_LASNI|nr:ctp synthase [Lasius niger]